MARRRRRTSRGARSLETADADAGPPNAGIHPLAGVAGEERATREVVVGPAASRRAGPEGGGGSGPSYRNRRPHREGPIVPQPAAEAEMQRPPTAAGGHLGGGPTYRSARAPTGWSCEPQGGCCATPRPTPRTPPGGLEEGAAEAAAGGGLRRPEAGRTVAEEQGAEKPPKPSSAPDKAPLAAETELRREHQAADARPNLR